MADEEAIQSTNDDATECKKSAVNLGYWMDPFVNLFVKKSVKKAPEINRGYYARVRGVESFIEQFLKLSEGQGQIINLGAGFDTLYWRLKSSGKSLARFIEIDFPIVTHKKCLFIKKNKQLLDVLNTEDGEIRFSTTDLHAANYHLLAVDLRNVQDLQNKLSQAEINFKLPTLILSECVLVYIEETSNLLKWLSSNFQSSLFISYEQVNMRDKFGEVMLSNLRMRGCLLAGVSHCDSLETQKTRFTSSGWDGSKAWTMVEIYESLPEADRVRIESIEMLDEQELLIQLLQHYCITIAWKGNLFKNITFPQD